MDHDGYCRCPLLRAEAEIERLAAATGVERERGGSDALIIGILRDKYGCRGPDRRGYCYWWKQVPAQPVSPQGARGWADLPLLYARRDGDRPGEYL